MKKGSKTRDLDKRQTNVEKQRQKKMRSELFIDQLVFYSMIHTERKKKDAHVFIDGYKNTIICKSMCSASVMNAPKQTSSP